MGKDVIIALDFDSREKTLAFLDRFTEEKPFVKVGMELFYAEGPAIVREIRRRGHRIFLDLKLHDIPNTVAQAVEVYARWGLWALTVHTSGGETMMRRAREAAGTDLLLLGVTVLTSLDGPEWEAVHPGCSLERALSGRAALARESGLGGVVCSPRDLTLVREAAPGLVTVVPGIRLPGDGTQDQARVDTPAAAMGRGADYLVVGRSILGAADPQEAAERVLGSMEEGRA